VFIPSRDFRDGCPRLAPRRALSDRYRIERELGRGGMATVFLAHDLKHDRQVALKVLHPELAARIQDRTTDDFTPLALADACHLGASGRNRGANRRERLNRYEHLRSEENEREFEEWRWDRSRHRLCYMFFDMKAVHAVSGCTDPLNTP
jgi:serine/threonine protein kinase